MMGSSHEKEAISSDDGLRAWEEVVEDTVSSAMFERLRAKGLDPEDIDIQSVGAEEPKVEEEEPTTRSLIGVNYVGEFLVDRNVGPALALQVCKDLKQVLNSEIISVEHSDAGTTIRFTVTSATSLLGALGQFAGVSSWDLVTT